MLSIELGQLIRGPVSAVCHFFSPEQISRKNRFFGFKKFIKHAKINFFRLMGRFYITVVLMYPKVAMNPRPVCKVRKTRSIFDAIAL